MVCLDSDFERIPDMSPSELARYLANFADFDVSEEDGKELEGE